jgi:hypothetical protein
MFLLFLTPYKIRSMKRILPLIIVLALFMAGCGSSRKQLEKGNYDAAIEKAVRELRRDSKDEKNIAILQQSYRIANEQDNERARYLKMENKSSNWDEVYLTYQRMNNRQSLVRTVTPLTLNGSTVDFPYVDYMPEMVAAKRKAADYYYAHGNELMKNGTKEFYRQAYAEFVRAKQYVDNYEGIDAKIQESKYLGISRVYVGVVNKSILKFPKEFEDGLIALDLPNLNSEWVEYHTQTLDNKIEYDYIINVNVLNIAVSPEQQVVKDTVVKKNVEDGFSYILDAKGNVRKDSLGNDMKQPKYKILQCALIQTIQSKVCQIDGNVEVIQINPNRVLKQDPLGANSYFENISSRALGDVEALTAAQKATLNSAAVPYPTDIEMVVRCSDALKQAIRSAMQTNRRYIN